jgi:CBS domain-containing membrane protein
LDGDDFGSPRGIIWSAGEAAKAVVSYNEMMSTKVSAIMTRTVESLRPGEPLSRADALIREKRYRHFPVVEKGRLVGILSERDVLRAALSTASGPSHQVQTDFLATVKVEEVMTRDVVTITPDEDVKDAALTMLSGSIGCLPVVEREAVVGLVTESDILRFVADG